MSHTLDALFYPYTICLEPTTLKYMLLLYDRVFYLPNDTSLNAGHESLSKRWSMRDGVLHTLFAAPAQTYRAMMYSSEPSAWDDEMSTLMEAYDELEERGICIPLKDERFEDTSRCHPLEEAVDADVQDQRFVYQATRGAHKKLSFPPVNDRFQMKGGGCSIRPFRYKQDLGTVELCAERINTTLLFAETHGLVPVSPHPSFVTLLNVKLRRALEKHGDRLDVVTARKKSSRFNMLSWELLAEVATPALLEPKSIRQILRYRDASAEAGQRFREFIFQLERELAEEPWSDAARSEISRIIQARVVPELQRAREAKAEVWNKLFDDTLTAIFSTTTVAAAGAIIPLAMHYVPGMTYLQLLSYSTAGLLAEVLPGLVGARRNDISYRNNALFFILNLQ